MSTPPPPDHGHTNGRPNDHDPLLHADDAFVAICLKMLRGELDGAACEALAQQLDADADKRRLFVQLSIQSQLIGEALDHQAESLDESDDPYAGDIMAELVESAKMQRRADEVAQAHAEQAEKERAARELEQRLRLAVQADVRPVKRVVIIPKAAVWLGLAAALGLVIWLGMLAVPSKPDAPPVAGGGGGTLPTPPQSPEPVYVAEITGSVDAVWRGTPPAGQLLLDSSFSLIEGYAEVTFNDGASVVIQAPAAFHLTGTNAMNLDAGRLTASCPESAYGFAVHTPGMLITDLGTEFGVNVDAASVQAHVFSGLVQVAASDREAMIASPIDLQGGDGARLDPERGVVRDEFNPGQFVRDLALVPYTPVASDTVCFLGMPPRSLLPGAIESNDWLYAILEQTSVLPSQPIQASLWQPGTYRSFAGDGRDVRLDSPVDSYLIHFDPIGNTESVILSGSITFPRPVVAVLGSEDQIIASDHWFAGDGTSLLRNPGDVFGLDGVEDDVPGAQLDQITLSEDRRTIRFRLHALRPFDEFRVLIEAAEVSP